MKLRIAFGMIFIIILSQLCVAYENILTAESGVERIGVIKIYVQENGFAQITEELVVNDTTVSLSIPENADDLVVTNVMGNEIIHMQQIISKKRHIRINVPQSLPDSKIIVSYSTQSIINKNASVWSIAFSSSATPSYSIFKIRFPEDSRIMSWTPNVLFTYLRDEDSLWLYPQEDKFNFRCEYETVQHSTVDSNKLLYIPIAVMIIVIIVLVIYLLILRKRAISGTESKKQIENETIDPDTEACKEQPTEKRIKSSILNMLDENERRIIEILEQSEDEITQAYIYKTTGMPKATLSDMMRRLENRNIITRRRDGRVNWIRLEDWVFSK
ncbi:MAG TPA: winged helix-turn-helix transcriptional regulator [Candidatus Altiarchaeales archaeon]|nr:winged helix-turn-helix transcriptional regulator [Candidatus Altiarchaeales archaeon]